MEQDLGLMPFGISIIIIVSVVAALWRVYSKAGQPGWGVLVPIYNNYLMLKVAGKPGWWLIWMFIPFASVVVHFITAVEIAKRFGHSSVYGFFLLGLFPIGYLFLGFGKDKYVASNVSASPTAQPEVGTPNPS